MVCWEELVATPHHINVSAVWVAVADYVTNIGPMILTIISISRIIGWQGPRTHSPVWLWLFTLSNGAVTSLAPAGSRCLISIELAWSHLQSKYIRYLIYAGSQPTVLTCQRWATRLLQSFLSWPDSVWRWEKMALQCVWQSNPEPRTRSPVWLGQWPLSRQLVPDGWSALS